VVVKAVPWTPDGNSIFHFRFARIWDVHLAGANHAGEDRHSLTTDLDIVSWVLRSDGGLRPARPCHDTGIVSLLPSILLRCTGRVVGTDFSSFTKFDGRRISKFLTDCLMASFTGLSPHIAAPTDILGSEGEFRESLRMRTCFCIRGSVLPFLAMLLCAPVARCTRNVRIFRRTCPQRVKGLQKLARAQASLGRKRSLEIGGLDCLTVRRRSDRFSWRMKATRGADDSRQPKRLFVTSGWEQALTYCEGWTSAPPSGSCGGTMSDGVAVRSRKVASSNPDHFAGLVGLYQLLIEIGRPEGGLSSGLDPSRSPFIPGSRNAGVRVNRPADQRAEDRWIRLGLILCPAADLRKGGAIFFRPGQAGRSDLGTFGPAPRCRAGISAAHFSIAGFWAPLTLSCFIRRCAMEVIFVIPGNMVRWIRSVQRVLLRARYSISGCVCTCL